MTFLILIAPYVVFALGVMLQACAIRLPDRAIDLVVKRLLHGEFGLTTAGGPKASFLVLEPTGVGKTELTLQFTADLVGSNRVVRLDMSECQTADRLGLLLGTADEPGRIAEGFDACAGRGTLLFDEIEKAHPRVLDVLLQLLDAARLTTGRNRVLDFSAWYVVLIRNALAGELLSGGAGAGRLQPHPNGILFELASATP